MLTNVCCVIDVQVIMDINVLFAWALVGFQNFPSLGKRIHQTVFMPQIIMVFSNLQDIAKLKHNQRVKVAVSTKDNAT